MNRPERRAVRPSAIVLTWVVALALVGGLLGGCMRLPESGPVLTSDEAAGTRADTGPFIEPAPPTPGESPAEIARHFLDAMMASSLQTNVARQFLTREAASSWDPEAATIIYGSSTTTSGTGSVSVELTGVNRLDGNGAWVGREESEALTFGMRVEDGEYRISKLPNALIVPERWFVQRFRPISLYYFDPTGHILVPEPVYVPRGEQLATSAVTALLAGPPRALAATTATVMRTFAPPGLSVELSVVVDSEGVARVSLQGDAQSLDPEVLPLFLAQLAWTLRQDPQVQALALSIGGEPVALPEGGTQLSIDFGAEYDPTVAGSSSLLFGLRDGRLIRASPGAEESLAGPFGRTSYGLREVSVDFDAQRVAGVTSDGGRVLLTAVEDPTASVEEVLSDGANLDKPSWDAHGDLWVLDRRVSGGRVAVISDQTSRSVTLDGVTGEATRRLLISRDGSRYAAIVGPAKPTRSTPDADGNAAGGVAAGGDAAVSAPGTDRLVVGWIERDADGTALRGVAARVVYPAVGETGLQVTSLGWVAADRLAVVLRVTQDRDQIRVIGVDAGPASLDLPTSSRLLGSRVTRLITSPRPNAPIYARTELPSTDSSRSDASLETPFEREVESSVDPEIKALTYVG